MTLLANTKRDKMHVQDATGAGQVTAPMERDVLIVGGKRMEIDDRVPLSDEMAMLAQVLGARRPNMRPEGELTEWQTREATEEAFRAGQSVPRRDPQSRMRRSSGDFFTRSIGESIAEYDRRVRGTMVHQVLDEPVKSVAETPTASGWNGEVWGPNGIHMTEQWTNRANNYYILDKRTDPWTLVGSVSCPTTWGDAQEVIPCNEISGPYFAR